MRGGNVVGRAYMSHLIGIDSHSRGVGIAALLSHGELRLTLHPGGAPSTWRRSSPTYRYQLLELPGRGADLELLS